MCSYLNGEFTIFDCLDARCKDNECGCYKLLDKPLPNKLRLEIKKNNETA